MKTLSLFMLFLAGSASAQSSPERVGVTKSPESMETRQGSFEPLAGDEVGDARSRVLTDPLKARKELWPYPEKG